MTGSIVFTSYLLFGSPPPPADFGAQFDHAKVVTGEDDVQFVAYDHAGQPIGSIALWVDAEGATGVYSEYPDGYAVVLLSSEGDIRTDASLPREVVAERADLIISYLDPYETAEEAKWMKCAALTGVMVATCGAGNIWACPFSAILAACECLPKLEPKWKNKSCTA